MTDFVQTPFYPDLDLSDFADPTVEAINIAGAAKGDAGHLEILKDELRQNETSGWCRIIYMDNEYAIVRWVDQFVIEVCDQSIARVGPDATQTDEAAR